MQWYIVQLQNNIRKQQKVSPRLIKRYILTNAQIWSKARSFFAGRFWYDHRQSPRISTIIYDPPLVYKSYKYHDRVPREGHATYATRASRDKLDSHLAECPVTLLSKQLAWYTLTSLFAFFLSFCSTRARTRPLCVELRDELRGGSRGRNKVADCETRLRDRECWAVW